MNEITLTLGGSVELVLRPPAPAIVPVITARLGSFVITAKGEGMAYTLQNGNFIEVQITYVDKDGNPAVVDGEVAWTSSNEGVASVDTDPTDSTRCRVSTVGEIGSAQIVATADADLGQGTREIITPFDVTVVAGEAVAGTINVIGDPQPLP